MTPKDLRENRSQRRRCRPAAVLRGTQTGIFLSGSPGIGGFANPRATLLAAALVLAALFFAAGCGSGSAPNYFTSVAERGELREVVNTDGTIMPQHPADIYAPLDGFVSSLQVHVGGRVSEGEILMHLQSSRLAGDLAGARAALLQARQEAEKVVAGPPPQELNEVESSISQIGLQLTQARSELARQEALLKRQATTKIAVEKERDRVSLLEAQLAGLRQKKDDILNLFSPQQKQWEIERVRELEKQVQALEEQVREATIRAPRSGVVYSLPVLAGSFATTGRLLVQIYVPGQVLLQAHVDEPDLARVAVGQEVRIQWSGAPGKTWTGKVELPAEEVVTLGARSVGNVVCSIEGSSTELIPNTSVNVRIIVAVEKDAVVIPRSAVFSRNGVPTVIVLEQGQAVERSVTLGIVTPNEVQIVKGVEPGEVVATNPNITAR